MKKKVTPNKLSVSLVLKMLYKNFFTPFETGSKKDFQRLKDFITS